MGQEQAVPVQDAACVSLLLEAGQVFIVAVLVVQVVEVRSTVHTAYTQCGYYQSLHVVVYHVTIVPIGHGLLKKFWPLVLLRSTHCRVLKYLKLCRPAYFVRTTQLVKLINASLLFLYLFSFLLSIWLSFHLCLSFYLCLSFCSPTHSVGITRACIIKANLCLPFLPLSLSLFLRSSRSGLPSIPPTHICVCVEGLTKQDA